MRQKLALTGSVRRGEASLQMLSLPKALGGRLETRHEKSPAIVLAPPRFVPDRLEVRQGPSALGALPANTASPAAHSDDVHRLQQIVDGSSVPTFVIDQNHVITHWNKACQRLTGKPAAEMVGTQEQWRAFYPDKRPVMADLILAGARTKEIACFYPGIFRKSALIDGAYEAEAFFPNFGEAGCWLYFTAAPLFDSRGEIIGAIETLQDITAQRKAEAALKQSEEPYRQLSITDNLTGLFNSRHFYSELKSEIARAVRHGHPLSLMLVDVDHFKQWNDTYGHLEGDHLLERLGGIIRNCLRCGDTAYRLGGDEFVVLLPETELESARMVAERLRSMFAAHHQLKPSAKPTVLCTLSIGVACYESSEAFTEFVGRADFSAYQAKHQGRNRVIVAQPRCTDRNEAGGTQSHWA